MVTVKLTQNVMYSGQHHIAGEIIDVSPEIAEQIVSQGLGVKASEAVPAGKNGAGPAASEPEPQGEEQVKAGRRVKSSEK